MPAGSPVLHTDRLHPALLKTVHEQPRLCESLSCVLRPAGARGRRTRCCVRAVRRAPPPRLRLPPSASSTREPPEDARRLACGIALSLCLCQRLCALASLPEEREHAVSTLVYGSVGSHTLTRLTRPGQKHCVVKVRTLPVVVHGHQHTLHGVDVPRAPLRALRRARHLWCRWRKCMQRSLRTTTSTTAVARPQAAIHGAVADSTLALPGL